MAPAVGSIPEARATQALLAEQRVAVARVAVIALAMLVYYGVMGRPGPHLALADALIVAASVYAAAVLLLRPYERFPALRSAAYTSTCDAMLITLWIFATGGYHSPFYALWLVSLTAVAFRFGLRATLLTAVLYAACDLALIAASGHLVPEHAGGIVARVGHIFILGWLGGMLADALGRETRSRVETRRRAEVALRRGNRTLQGVLRASPVPLVALDESGRVRLWTPAAARAFGWSAEQVLHRPPPFALRASDAPYSMSVRSATGAEVDVDVATSVLPENQGVVVALADVTQRNRQALELEASRKQAAMRERLSALGTLVAGVAHEVNNPLMYIQLAAELAQLEARDAVSPDATPEQARAHAEEVVRLQEQVLEGVRRIAEITRALKQVARESTGARVDADPNELARAALTVAHVRFPRATDSRVEEGAQARVVVAPGEIGQVLLNLLLNAAEALGENEHAQIVVATRDEGAWVVLEVRDNGPGIPEDVQARIFTPFFTTKETGTGLGLSVSHGIVEAHGGTLTCESVVGRGTTFRVRLPAARPLAGEAAAQPAPTRAS